MKELTEDTAQAEPGDLIDTMADLAEARGAEAKSRLDEAEAKMDAARASAKQWAYTSRGLALSFALALLAALVYAKHQRLPDRDFYTIDLYGILFGSSFAALTFPRVSIAYLNLIDRFAYKGKYQALVGTAMGGLVLLAMIGIALLLSFLGGRLAAI